MSSFLHCESNDCQVCDECVAQQITTKIENICKIVCPCCGKPEQLDEENSMQHFQHLSHKVMLLVFFINTLNNFRTQRQSSFLKYLRFEIVYRNLAKFEN